jgi:hypothetical protein
MFSFKSRITAPGNNQARIWLRASALCHHAFGSRHKRAIAIRTATKLIWEALHTVGVL